MKTKNRVIPALLFSLFAAAGLEAQAAQFSGVVVFGDSLSDAGFYRGFLASLGLPAAQMGRFGTNPDPVWSELISQFYGFPAAPSNAGGTIYAQGGARVALTPGFTPQGFAERPISTQITEYLCRTFPGGTCPAGNPGVADPNALFTIWGGANDFLVNNTLLQAGAITPAQFQTNVLAAATAEVQQAGRLYVAGARYVVVLGGFDVAMTPGVAGLDAATRAGLTALTVGYNTTLWTGFAGANLHPIPVDLFTLFNEIRANPGSFGFTNITGVACGPFPPFTSTSSALFCLIGQNVAPNAQNTFLFADPTGHLTGATNRLIAQFVESLIEGPYQYSQLAEVPLRTRTLHVQGVADGLLNAQKSELGKWTIFASAGGGNYDVDSGVGNVGVNNDLEAYTVGATMRTSESVTLGIAYGQTKSSASFGQGAGGFRTRDHNWSLFGTVALGGFHGTAVATVSDIDFDDMRRNVTLGALTRSLSANTSGSNASVFVNAGYDFAFGGLRIGPVVSFTGQDVSVAGFTETGAGSSALRIFEQKRRSEVWSAGLRASFDLGNWTPWIRVTADEEQKDDLRFVTAMPVSLTATGNTYDIPAYVGDSSWTTFAIGVRGWITRNIGLAASYYNVTSRSGISEQGATATVSVKF